MTRRRRMWTFVYSRKKTPRGLPKPDSGQEGVEGGQKSVGGLLLYRAALHAEIFFPLSENHPS